MQYNTWNHPHPTYLSTTPPTVTSAQTQVEGWPLPTTSSYQPHIQSQYSLLIEGVPGKRRADTQIKLQVKLVDAFSGGNPVSRFDSLYVYKKNSTTTSSNDRQPTTLRLFLGVESATTGREIICCDTCYTRERSKSSNPGGPGSLALTLAYKSLVGFSTGECIVAFRITCYCTHHEETIGFRVRLVLMDYCDNIIAETLTSPIMIIDDHKQAGKKAKEGTDGVRRARAITTPMTVTQSTEFSGSPTSADAFMGTGSSGSSSSGLANLSWGSPSSPFEGIAPTLTGSAMNAYSDNSSISTSYTSTSSYYPFGSVSSNIEQTSSDGSIHQGQNLNTIWPYNGYSPQSSPSDMFFPPPSYPPNFSYPPGPPSFGAHSFPVNVPPINPVSTNPPHEVEAGGMEVERQQVRQR